jgi:bifunctional oligoribonuclease and PAP phosphatase NrnA
VSESLSSLRRSAIETLLPPLLAARKVVLTTHLNADGDGAGCEAALASWLAARGVESVILNPTPFPANLAFLLEDPSVVVDAADLPSARAAVSGADLALVVDTGEVPRIGRVKPLLEGIPMAVVDHHPEGERPLQGISFRDSEASATGELVHDLVEAAGGPWTRAVVNGLYVAILTDTGGFRFSNTSPAALRTAAALVERGASPEGLNRAVYGTAPLRRLRLLAASLPTVEAEDGVAWMVVPRAAYEATGATPDDLEGFVDHARSLEGVEVGLLFRTVHDGGTKISFRSNGPVDVNALARRFGGGGHVRAAGALVALPLDEVMAQVVPAVKEAVAEVVDGVPSGGGTPAGAGTSGGGGR